ncbi:M16 family metallopeptidase [Aggregatibacter kilianii]|uniref:M16 family metallopeptidase n=1 Tax=Aggregatibacter kilianii TaxID=2025884 RepID=UPI0013A630C9|nr:M16 family metallopeptidase [Aggregatibacter kilianii]
MTFRTFIFLAFSVLALNAGAQETPQQEAPKIVQGKLGNGLRYSLVPLHEQKNRIDIRLRVNAGSVDETEAQMGGAHMVEHMVFRGTTQYPQGVMKMLLDAGWKRAQSYNAVTNADTTTYMFSPPKGAQDLAFTLNVLDQMMFHATMSQKDLDDERKIIQEEWRSGQGVGARMNMQRTASIRADSRYARWPVIGSQQSIETMPAEALQTFYRTWYHPNNMHLMIIGDVQPNEAEALINAVFSQEKMTALPPQNYRDPQLTERIQFNQLGDEKSAVSQIAYIFRFNENAARQHDEKGRKLRLLERLALSALSHRLQNQKKDFPQGVNALVVRKSDIGTNTAAVGLFAGVEGDAHQLGLQQILIEIARLNAFPLTQKELDAEKKTLYEQLDFALKGGKHRQFEEWVNVMNSTLLMDKPYLSQPQIAKRSKPILDAITPQDVQQLLEQWFSATDRIVQYQSPRMAKIAPIDQTVFNRVQQQVAQLNISAPIEKETLPPMELLPIENAQAGNIVKEQRFPAENVVYWQLENGDKVVWLKSALEKDRTLFRAVNSGGYMAQGLSPWQSQMAVQMMAQSAPENWQIEQLTQWKKDRKVNLNLEQKADHLIFNGETDNANLADLLRLYYALEIDIVINDGVDETVEDMQKMLKVRSKNVADREISDARQTLRFGNINDATLPTEQALAQVTADSLNQQWQSIRELPTTYYFVNDLSADHMKKLVQTYLAPLPRNTALTAKLDTLLSGSHRAVIKANVEPRTDLYLDFYSPHPWKGEDAMLVALIRPIMANKLKAGLRDESLGIYRLRLESTLDPTANRIESQLFFGAKPENMPKLMAQAKQILADLPQSITQADIDQAKQGFAQQEKARQNDARTQLNRLILSETHYGNPSYLSESKKLLDSITLENVKTMAKKVSDLTHSAELVVEPK